MWKLSRSRVLLDEPPEEEDGLRGEPPPAADAAAAQSLILWRKKADDLSPENGDTGPTGSETRLECSEFVPERGSQVQGAGFRGWKEVTSLSNNDDEQHLLGRCKAPKSRGTSLRLKEELRTEKKSGFWDSLVLKQNIQSKKPDEIEGWEPPKLSLEDVASESGDSLSARASGPGWEEGAKGSGKYTSLATPGSGSRWSLRSAGKLVSIRRQSRGHLTESWEELE